MNIYTRKLLRLVREAKSTNSALAVENFNTIKSNHDQFVEKVIHDIFNMETFDRVKIQDSPSIESGIISSGPYLKMTFTSSIDNSFLTLVIRPGNQSFLEIGVQPSDKGLEAMFAYELDDSDSSLYKYITGSAYKRYFADSKVFSDDKCSLQYYFTDRQLCGRYFDEYFTFIVGHAIPFIQILDQIEEQVSLAA